MPRASLTGAPQLSRMLRELSVPLLKHFLSARDLAALAPTFEDGGEDPADKGRASLQAALATLPPDALRAIEVQAARVTRLATERADALHLRLSEGPGFDCHDQMMDEPGALARATTSYRDRQSLFVATERAMELRSFREHQTRNEGYDLEIPVGLDLDGVDEVRLADAVKQQLGLRDGCSVETVEMPGGDHSHREIMIAISGAGPLASQRTFESDRSTAYIHYRPLSELILAYRPDIGRIEVCGRRWIDRSEVAKVFAEIVLGVNTRLRPLVQRNYDLGLFRGNLNIEIPAGLRDRVLSLHVTELRVALGSYDRKITLSATPGQDIEAMRQQVFGRRGGQLRGFVCDVELLLEVTLGHGRKRKLRFRLDNHNSSTLPSNTDPELRAIGFELLEGLGVIARAARPETADVPRLIPALLILLDRSGDQVSGPELRQIGLPPAVLEASGFLRRRQIVDTLLIDDDDLGPVTTEVEPDPQGGSARLHPGDEVADRVVSISEVSTWQIDRERIMDAILLAGASLGLGGGVRELEANLWDFGEAAIDGVERRLLFTWGLTDDAVIARIDRAIWLRPGADTDIVLAASAPVLGHIGGRPLVSLPGLLDPETGLVSIDLLRSQLAAGHPAADQKVRFHRLSPMLAELVIEGRPPWTIIGEKRADVVADIAQAFLAGRGPVKVEVLRARTEFVSMSGLFDDGWDRAKSTWLQSPSKGFWTIRTSPTSD